MDSVADEFPEPLLKDGRYDNPWTFLKGIYRPSFFQVFKAFYQEESKPDIPSKKKLDSIEEMKILSIDEEKLKSPPGNSIQATWLGHASFLIQMNKINYLFDPVFSDRIGPLTSLSSYLGMKRYRKCPITVSELPNIDFVIISHDHYDHLDAPTVIQLDKRFHSNITWCVPMGTKSWLANTIGNTDNVHEMTWWEEKKFIINGGEITIACTPAQHWCKRTAFDDNQRLWASWVVKSSRGTLFHSGDTGYCDVFKGIGKRYGPFDLSMIAIGAYQPNNVLAYQHVNPVEAVKVHQDIHSKQSIGMHWGTFNLSYEHYLEPPKLLQETVEKNNLHKGEFITMKHGQTRSFEMNDGRHEDDMT